MSCVLVAWLSNLLSDSHHSRQAFTHTKEMAEKVPDLRTASAEFASYIAGKNRYVSITEQQGPLRPGESQLRGPRRQYIKTRMEWDPQKACWMNRDGRPLITRDLIWETIIKEMRQLDSYGQRKVWSIVKAKYDGIQEDDVRAVCKAWVEHNLEFLNAQDNSLWDLDPNPQRSPVIEEVARKRPSRQAKTDIEGLRSVGGGIYGSDLKSFAQEAAERVSRTHELAEFVGNTTLKPSKRGQRMRSKSESSPPFPMEDENDGNDDEDNDNDDDDGDYDGDYEEDDDED